MHPLSRHLFLLSLFLLLLNLFSPALAQADIGFASGHNFVVLRLGPRHDALYLTLSVLFSIFGVMCAFLGQWRKKSMLTLAIFSGLYIVVGFILDTKRGSLWKMGSAAESVPFVISALAGLVGGIIGACCFRFGLLLLGGAGAVTLGVLILAPFPVIPLWIFIVMIGCFVVGVILVHFFEVPVVMVTLAVMGGCIFIFGTDQALGSGITFLLLFHQGLIPKPTIKSDLDHSAMVAQGVGGIVCALLGLTFQIFMFFRRRRMEQTYRTGKNFLHL